MKRIIYLSFIFTILLSCKKHYFISPNQREFVAYQKINEEEVLIRFNANKIASSSIADAYIQEGYHIDKDIVNKIMDNFTQIFIDNIETYGAITDVDQNKKILLVFFNINGDKVLSGESYIGGYFYSGDLISGEGNDGEILYIDCINVENNVDALCGTIAHEFQHLINYYMNDILLERPSDLWLNEALSESSEILYRKAIPQHRLIYYNRDPKNIIANGQYFYIWNNIVENYSTVSLFMYWLATHSANGYSIYKDIAQAGYLYRGSYLAVLNAAKNNIPDLNRANWGKILLAWFEANYRNNLSGIYGYKGNIEISPPRSATSSTGQINLYPGHGVYISDINIPQVPGILYKNIDDIKLALNPNVELVPLTSVSINVPQYKGEKTLFKKDIAGAFFIDFHPKRRRIKPSTNN